MSEAVVCVLGTDATMVNDAVHATVNELLEGLDPSTALEDFAVKESAAAEDESSTVVQRTLEALNTPPFLVPRRVVVLRDVQALGAEDADYLVSWASSPTPGITLVVSVVGTKSKSKLVKAAHRVVDVTVGSRPKDRLAYISEQFEAAGVTLQAGVAAKIADRVGDDVARVDALCRTLRTIFGIAPLSFDHVEPYLGDAGGVPEWDLTEAIDKGQVAEAIRIARRMLDSRARVGVQIINLLQRHYLKMARLDGSGASTGEDAAAIVGGHPFPAQKLVQSARLLGGDRIAYAIDLIARADLDLKGGADYGGTNDDAINRTDLTVVEVLVARLAKLAEAARRH